MIYRFIALKVSVHLTACLVELSCVFAASSQPVKPGLVSLCPPDWHRKVCDRPERHQSPIRSTTLINCLKNLGARVRRKAFSPLQKAIKSEQGGELSDTRGVVCTFIDGLEPESFVCVQMCVYVARRGDYEPLCLRC